MHPEQSEGPPHASTAEAPPGIESPMRPFTLIALGSLALAATPSPAQAVPPSGTVTLTQLRDRFRVLLIFAAHPTDPQLEIQLRTLNQHAPEAAELDLIPIALPYASPSPTRATLSSQEADGLRRRLGIAPPNFAVVLLGKDGGKKLRSSKPLTIERLNATIDAMPMRQDEMHRNGSVSPNPLPTPPQTASPPR